MGLVHSLTFRVRYAETDQMGALSSPRALEWFELGRTEWLRAVGMPYSQMENQGVFLPVVEVNCRYQRRVRFDDPIILQTHLSQIGRATIRFEYLARLDSLAGSDHVLSGWTTHAFVDSNGRVIRPVAETIAKLQQELGRPMP